VLNHNRNIQSSIIWYRPKGSDSLWLGR